MHFRLQLWMALFALVATAAIGAEPPAAPANAPAPAAAAMPPGQIKAVKLVGSVSYTLNGQTVELHEGDAVPQSATVLTQGKSSVILVFSNGATTQLGEDSSLSIDEFLQDPFTAQIAVASLTAEPTVSHTRLHLTKGELLGNVKHLNHDKGSTFTIETPVGAAGIRGTTFRIVFRPSGTGQAFAIFSLSTLEGNVAFNNPSSPSQPTNPQGTKPNQGQTRGGPVAVTTGQEVVVTVSVDVNPTTGQVTVTAPVQVATTTPLNPVVRAEIISQATTMASTVEQSQTTFNSTAGATSGGSSSGSSSSGSSTSSTDSTDKGKDDKTKDASGATSGGDSSGSSSSSTSSTSSSSTSSTSSSSTSGSSSGSSSGTSSTGSGSTSNPSSSGSTGTGAASTLTSSIAGGRQINTSPGFKSTVNDLTPGAGG
jgi:hypothetical protein